MKVVNNFYFWTSKFYEMEWYKIIGLIVVVLFTISAILTDGFAWLSNDDSPHDGGLHP